MTLPRGTEIYNLDVSHVSSRGVCYSMDELNNSLDGEVKKILFDTQGTSLIKSILSGIAATDFEDQTIKQIFSSHLKPENWRVGEALAEVYLVAHRHCSFPWPGSRDKKNDKASLPGTDIVGFQETSNMDNRFAFGEVKTSSEHKHPPSVMNGLKSQLEDLCTNVNTRDTLVRYLGHHAKYSSWEVQYKNAFIRYMKDNVDVSLFGVIVRDTNPTGDDLKKITRFLVEKSTPPLSVDLLALYLPGGSINDLSSKVMTAAKEGEQ